MRALTTLAAVLAAACGSPSRMPAGGGVTLVVEAIPSAASARSRCPRLSGSGEQLALSWVEELAPDEHRLMVSLHGAGRWSDGLEVCRGEDWFVNWADTPGAVANGERLLTHWLVDEPGVRNAYRAEWSIDDAIGPERGGLRVGATRLHDDLAVAEHGFVSAVPAGDGFFSIWLDGRATPDGGAMALMGRTLGVGGSSTAGPEIELDARVCSCCPTAAVTLWDGTLLAAYRDRSAQEVRDIALVRGRPGDPGSWSSPRIVHDDGWVILGCPVNGPALAASAKRVALAWFTMGQRGEPLVQVAFSADGEHFGWPIPVDDGMPFGRVAIAAVPGRDAFVVGWLERSDQGVQWRLRMLEEGAEHESVALADVSGERSDGMLALASGGTHTSDTAELFASWTDGAGESIRLARVRVVTDPMH